MRGIRTTVTASSLWRREQSRVVACREFSLGLWISFDDTGSSNELEANRHSIHYAPVGCTISHVGENHCSLGLLEDADGPEDYLKEKQGLRGEGELHVSWDKPCWEPESVHTLSRCCGAPSCVLCRAPTAG